MKTKVPEDVVHASVQMNSGAFGSIEASWLSTGRTMQHDLEIYGTEGSITFSQERLSEFNLYLKTELSTLRGFRRIEAGPQHEPYGRLCAAQGHQLGFNELKAIEMGAFIRAISDRNLATFDFERAFRVTKLTEAVRTSAENDAVWVNGL
jgi:predicted dehydrogenase